MNIKCMSVLSLLFYFETQNFHSLMNQDEKKTIFIVKLKKNLFFLLFLQRKTLKSDVLSSQIGEGTY